MEVEIISGNRVSGDYPGTIRPNGDIDYDNGYTARKEEYDEQPKVSGKITWMGLWKDSGDRAMPIKMNVNPGNSN
jgi:hypothetical protein